jgi:hypothetical protein
VKEIEALGLIPLAVLLGLLLKLLLLFGRHPLPQDAHLLHDLCRVPLRVIPLQILPLLLAEEYVGAQGPPGCRLRLLLHFVILFLLALDVGFGVPQVSHFTFHD